MVGFKQNKGVPSSGSTANLTPMPKGEASWVKAERVPAVASSMMVLETSAGKGFLFSLLNSKWVASETVESEHFGGLNEEKLLSCNWVLVFGFGVGFEGVNQGGAK